MEHLNTDAVIASCSCRMVGLRVRVGTTIWLLFIPRCGHDWMSRPFPDAPVAPRLPGVRLQTVRDFKLSAVIASPYNTSAACHIGGSHAGMLIFHCMDTISARRDQTSHFAMG